MSAFTNGDKTEGRKEVERSWARAEKKGYYKQPIPTQLDYERWEREISNLPAFSLLPNRSNYLITLDTNPNI